MVLFKDLGLDEEILRAIEDLGFESPMPVQEKVIVHVLQDEYKDLIGLAQTGTGKTAAFGLPLIQKTNPKLNKIQHVILSPTRELCLQITDDLVNFSKYKEGIKIAAVFGGASIERQIEKIKKGAQIISATPGRLVDLINRNVIDLSHIKTVVLDEADEMLNIGFRAELEAILSETPAERNTLLFSATMPKPVQAIASNFMVDPIEITIGRKNSGAENVKHVLYVVNQKDRYLAVKRIVDFHPDIYGIVFCRTRRETQEVADALMNDGYNADALHGELSQVQRDLVMSKFRSKHIQILVATDVAARGLDVDDLTHIINYNLPEELEVYTHRSGRTGRAGKKGESIIIINVKEKGKVSQIEKQLQKKFIVQPVPNGKEICEKQLFHLIDRMEKVEVDTSQIEPFLGEIYKKLEWLDREELIQKFVSVEFNRFLDYYKNAKDINVSLKPKAERDESKPRTFSGYTRFFINLGKTDNLTPTLLIGLINDCTNTNYIEIGEIEILRNFSFFEAENESAELLMNSFQGKVFKKREIVLEISEKKKERSSSGRRGDRKEFGKFSDKKRERSGGKDRDRRGGGSGFGSRDKGKREDSGFGGRDKAKREDSGFGGRDRSRRSDSGAPRKSGDRFESRDRGSFAKKKSDKR